MSRIFISYAREDADVALRIYDDLKDDGLDPWLDTQDLLPGEEWERTITHVIRDSSYFLALISKYSVGKSGFVQKELRQGLCLLDKLPPGRLFVIPVRLEAVEPSHDKLSQLHWVDLFRSYDEALAKIKRAILQRQSSKRPAATDSLWALRPEETEADLYNISGFWSSNEGPVLLAQSGDDILGRYAYQPDKEEDWAKASMEALKKLNWSGEVSGRFVNSNAVLFRWSQHRDVLCGCGYWYLREDELLGTWYHQYEFYRYEDLLDDFELRKEVPIIPDQRWVLRRGQPHE